MLLVDRLSLYCLILCNFHKLLRNVISEPWFICINVECVLLSSVGGPIHTRVPIQEFLL